MENERHPQAEQPHTFDSDKTSTTIINPDVLQKRLQEKGVSFLLYRGDRDDLPDPVTNAQISYEHDANSDEIFFRGDLTFTPPAPDDKDKGVPSAWQMEVIDYLDEALGASGANVLTLPHHMATIYSMLDSTYAMQFTLTEDTHTCTIAMHLERISEVCAVVGREYDPPEDEDTPTHLLAKDFIAQWNIALSSLKYLYGNRNKTDTITISVVEPSDAPIETTATPSPEIHRQPSTTFEDVGGAFEAKKFLEVNSLAFKHPELAARYDITPQSFLLHGPEGTGKTTLVHAFVGQIGAELREYASTDIVNKYVGASGEQTAKIFEVAKTISHPLVLFFDEFDSLAPKGNEGTSERQDVKNIFKRELTALVTHPNIIVAAATNKDPDSFDTALIRAGRLTPVYVPIPNDEERADVWRVMFTRSVVKLDGDIAMSQISHEHPVDCTVYAPDIDLAMLNQETSGMTGADIEQILQYARAERFMQAVKTGAAEPVTQTDILRAIHAYQKP